jgi:hypothetical protein
MRNYERKKAGQLGTRRPRLAPSCAWARYDSYEIREGHRDPEGYIRPAPGAKLHWFDPWLDYEAARQTTRSQPPYQSLLALADKLGLAELGMDVLTLEAYVYLGESQTSASRQVFPLSQTQKHSILEWCSRWGLLGILPNDFLAAKCAPRWKRNPEHGFYAEQTYYARTNGIWHSSSESLGPISGPRVIVEGGVVELDWAPPCVIVQTINGGGDFDIRSDSLYQWHDFFTDIPIEEFGNNS